MTARIDWHWPASFTGHECHRERDMLVNRHTNVAAVLGPTGVLFGASILGRSGPHTWLARRVLTILEASFDRVEPETIGSVAIFAASNPRSRRRSD